MGRSAAGTILRDVGLLIISGLLFVLVAVISHINPPTKADDARPPGTVMIEAFWADEADVDVDLWVQGPGDRPVGYSNKGGALFNLLRDDIGVVMDASGKNYENAYSRGVAEGEYAVNLHLYSLRAGQVPLSVKVVVSVRIGNTAIRQIIVTDVALERVGHEVTAVRFALDSSGNLISGSVRTTFKPLRSQR